MFLVRPIKLTYSWSHASWLMTHSHLDHITASTNNNWFQTVTEDKQNAVTEHHEGKAVLHGQPVLEKGTHEWCSGGGGQRSNITQRGAPFLPLQMSPTETWTDGPDDSGGRHRYHCGLQAGIPHSTVWVFFFSVPFNQAVPHTYVKSTKGNKRWTAGAKPRQSSCSNLPTSQSLLEQ